METMLESTSIHNVNVRYRRQIANGSLSGDGLPAATNMREIIWDDELASLAELWASQCPSTIDPVRKYISNAVEEEVRSSLHYLYIN